MRTGFSPSAPTSIAPSIRHTIWRSGEDLPHRSVPRMPAVTVATRMLTSRRRVLCSRSVVNRNAPWATRSAALKMPPLSGSISLISSDPFSPSLTRLPSESLTRARDPAPVFTVSPAFNSMPTASGLRSLPCSTQAGICTPSTTAACWPNAICANAAVPIARNNATIRFIWIAPVVPYVRLYAPASGPDSAAKPLIIRRFHARPGLNSHAGPVRPPQHRKRSPGVLGIAALVPRDGGSDAGKILLPVDVSLSVRQAPHGACQELHHRRRAHAPLPHARQERAATDGLGRVRPAGGERRDGEQGATRQVDARQHRLHEAAAEGPGLRARLGAGTGDLRSELLQVEPVAVHAPLQERARLQEDRRRQLGPGRPDGARQRAGDRGTRLAHRRAGGEARNPDVLLPHHEVRRGAAGRARWHGR